MTTRQKRWEDITKHFYPKKIKAIPRQWEDNTEYFCQKKIKAIPRLPLAGTIDITYRCNNNCLHCWLRIPPDAKEKKDELSLKEIKDIVGQARKMGCRSWSITGGEPMLRGDFIEILDYITSNSALYSLNTNGTLINRKIARLLKRRGDKMVALYGATARVNDHITGNPGSFEATMRGFAYLKEAGAAFTVQLIPMKDNYHQFNKMISLAGSLSKHLKIGVGWLYLSACGRKDINQRIIRQRLPPQNAMELNKPDLSYEDRMDKDKWHHYRNPGKNGGLFAYCVANRDEFHIDPYGQTTFCSFIKTAELRYDLRNGNFQEYWDKFMPSLATKIPPTAEYWRDCGSCQLRENCYWCPAYAYLEKSRFDVRVDYLCRMARENKKYRDARKKRHRRYYRITDINIQLDSDLPIRDNTFHPMFKLFETNGPGENTIYISHHFWLPDLKPGNLGRELYRKPPWAIYRKGDKWVYLGISVTPGDKRFHQLMIFNHNYTRALIYNNGQKHFLKGNLDSLSLAPTDQIFLVPALADREGLYLHSCGVIFQGQGLLFVGHSNAGKSTIANMLKDKAELLCDERIIVKKHAGGFRIYGTWSHGDVPQVSPNSAPLKAIMFLNKSETNQLELMNDRLQINKMLLAYLIKPLVTAEWWEKMLILTEKMTNEIPCYSLYFDKNSKIDWLLEKFL